MQKSANPNRESTQVQAIVGTHAILGVDVVAFSKLHDEDQIKTMERLIDWIKAALQFRGVAEDQYRWSPAGDGGYLTFAATAACRRAIDVAFSICENAKSPQFRARGGEVLQLRLALHAGTVEEAREFGHKTNIWGLGINTTARILALANPVQMLMSKQYFDLYIKDQREAEFEFGEPHWRTVKHSVQLEVMNVNKGGLCLSNEDAKALCWQDIGGLWRKTVKEYNYLIEDALRSGDSMAALAAAKFLLKLNEPDPLDALSLRIGRAEKKPAKDYPIRDASIFSQMPSETLKQVIAASEPQLFPKGSVICRQGESADSCFFVASGAIALAIPNIANRTRITAGEIIGEFSLWIPNIRRTATLLADEESLLLTIPNERFVNILKQDEHIAEMIYSRIKDRIISNVRRSAALFPSLRDRAKNKGKEIPAKCEMFAAGTKLDLKKSLYVIFNGAVSITPNNSPLVIRSHGDFGPDTVVGIICDIGDPDGESAIVDEPMVAVVFPREAVRALQKDSEEMSDVWNALGGRRQGKILRTPASASNLSHSTP